MKWVNDNIHRHSRKWKAKGGRRKRKDNLNLVIFHRCVHVSLIISDIQDSYAHTKRESLRAVTHLFTFPYLCLHILFGPGYIMSSFRQCLYVKHPHTLMIILQKRVMKFIYKNFLFLFSSLTRHNSVCCIYMCTFYSLYRFLIIICHTFHSLSLFVGFSFLLTLSFLFLLLALYILSICELV